MGKVKFTFTALVALQVFSSVSLAQDKCTFIFTQNSVQSVAKATTSIHPQKTLSVVQWLSAQTARTRNHFSPLQKATLVKNFEKFILFENQKPKDMITPLETDQFMISIIDTGLAPHKPVQVIMTDKLSGKKEVLLSSLKLDDLNLSATEKENTLKGPTIAKYRNNNTVIPVWAQLSPLRDYLLVKVSKQGSIDGHTLVIIRLADRKIIQELENVSTADSTWISSNTFSISDNTVEKAPYTITINSDPAGTIIKSKLEGSRPQGSADQQWFASRTREGNTLISSTTQNISFQIPRMNIESIFKTTKNPDTLWIQSNGKMGFKEVFRLVIKKDPNGNNGEVSITQVIPEGKTVIEEVEVANQHLIVSTYLGADRWMEVRDLNGKPVHKLLVPDCCTASFSDYNPQTGELSVLLSSPIQRVTRWIYNIKTQDWSLRKSEKEIVKANPLSETMTLNGQKYVTRYDSYKSKDGTVIPVRVTHKEGLKLSEATPALMEGYGGFALNNYFHPSHDPMLLQFIKSGGLHIAPALRGSYFFGETWHAQGRALNKQNVIDDFIGAAEWAIQNKMTSPKKLAISGGSHGGLVVAASIVQRPELFGLAFPQYGPLSFHDKPLLDPKTTPFQVQEYGDLTNDPEAQSLARKISPELGITPRAYPMTVVITGRQDSRVNPDHSIRFASRLMKNQTGDQPIYLYTNNNAGHWMSSLQRQDFIAWRSRVTYWSLLFDYMKMDFNP